MTIIPGKTSVTTNPAVVVHPREVESFVQIWVQSMIRFAEQVGSAGLLCESLAAPREEVALSPDDVWVTGAWSGSVRGEVACRVPPASAVPLAKLLMNEAPAEVTLSGEYKEGAVESLRQVAGMVASAVGLVRGDVQVRVEAASGAPSWPAGSVHWLRAGPAGVGEILIELRLSAALLAGLRSGQSHPSEAGSAEVPFLAAEGNSRFDALMDVEVETVLRFGERQLLLREILELAPGSLVELDRRVEDPVDLMLDGKVIARGEVVVMDGNYGLRVTEILGRQARQASGSS